MKLQRIVGLALSGLVMSLGAGGAFAQAFPSKTIRIVTSEPGGGNDFTARLVTPDLTTATGQTWIVENRGGAGGVIAIETVARAAPDGYTLVLYNDNMWTLPLIQSVPYDPIRDFSPITLMASAPNILVIHPSFPVSSVKELIAMAKAKPGQLNYASGGTGSSNHMAAELFNSMAGIKTVRIPHKGSGQALIGLMAGQMQFMFPNAAGGSPHVKSGKLKALAVTSAKPSKLFPDLPTVAETLPGYESASNFGMFAPAKTPAAIINRLNQEIVKVLERKEIEDKFRATGTEVVGSTPQEFAASIKADIGRLAKVVKDANIKGDQ